MNIEQQKKLYEEGNHICVLLRAGEQLVVDSPAWNLNGKYRLIHKKHEHILQAYLDGCEVYKYKSYKHTDQTEGEYLPVGGSFILLYEEGTNYLAVPKSLENCYCECTLANYQKLKYNSNTIIKHPYSSYIGGFYIDNELLLWGNIHKTIENTRKVRIIEYNEQIQKWVYCPKEAKDEVDRNTLGGIASIITTSDTNLPINNFEEFCFTADFTCQASYDEYLEVLVGKVDGMNLFWSDKGRPYKICKEQGALPLGSKYNITPIVPEVEYPIFKKTPDGTIAKIDSNGYRIFVLCPDLSKLGYIDNILCDANWIHNWMDVLYDSERGLYHGQPVWLFKGDNLPRVFLYNATNTSLYSPSEVLFYNKIESLDKVEPISIKALKQMPFIWKQYKAFIKEN